MSGDFFAVTGVEIRRGGILPAAFAREPERDAEMRISEKRSEMVFVAGGEHAAVMIEFGVGELIFFGFDAGPFDAEAVSVEAEVREHGDVLSVEMVVVAGVAGRFLKDAFRDVFEGPEIAGGVVAFDLMAGGGGAPEEFVGEGFGFVGGRRDWRCDGAEVGDGVGAESAQECGGGGALKKSAAGDVF